MITPHPLNKAFWNVSDDADTRWLIAGIAEAQGTGKVLVGPATGSFAAGPATASFVAGPGSDQGVVILIKDPTVARGQIVLHLSTQLALNIAEAILNTPREIT